MDRLHKGLMIWGVLTCFLFAFAKTATAQHLFKEHYDECTTERFALESEIENAKIDEQKIVALLLKDLDEKQLKRLKGKLTLQILVDTDGTSCLLSVENEINIKSKVLNLKDKISSLIWIAPEKKVAAIVAIRFKKGKYEVKRLGMNADLGVHTLKED